MRTGNVVKVVFSCQPKVEYWALITKIIDGGFKGDYHYSLASGHSSGIITDGTFLYYDIKSIEDKSAKGTLFDKPDIKIGEHTVEFLSTGGIKVGCTTVAREVVLQIADELRKTK